MLLLLYLIAFIILITSVLISQYVFYKADILLLFLLLIGKICGPRRYGGVLGFLFVLSYTDAGYGCRCPCLF